MNEREKLFNKDTISFYYDNNYYDQDLVWIFNPMYGNCLQINMESILKVEKYKQNSLHIELMFKDIVEFEKPKLQKKITMAYKIICFCFLLVEQNQIHS